MSVTETIILVETIITAAGFVTFAALYAILTRWWEDELGQALMHLAVIVALFLVLALAARAGLTFVGWFRVGMWALLMSAAVRLPWVFLKTRAADRPRVHQERQNAMTKYKRALVALATVLVAVLLAMVDPGNGITIDDGVSGTEAYALLGLTVGAFGVVWAPDVPGYRQIKPVIMGVSAILGVLTMAAVSDGLQGTEIVLAVVALLGTFGIRAVTNSGDYSDRAVPPLARPPLR